MLLWEDLVNKDAPLPLPTKIYRRRNQKRHFKPLLLRKLLCRISFPTLKRKGPIVIISHDSWEFGTNQPYHLERFLAPGQSEIWDYSPRPKLWDAHPPLLTGVVTAVWDPHPFSDHLLKGNSSCLHSPRE